MNPVTDPWIVTQREKIKYQEQFKSLQPLNGYVTGAQAKGFFLQSQLPPIVLGQIWALADTDSDGKMNINEFSIACKLINLKLRGLEIPKVLPPSILASLSSAPVTPSITPPTNIPPLHASGGVAPKSNGQASIVPTADVPAQITAVQNVPVAVMPPGQVMMPAVVPQNSVQSSAPVAGGIPLIRGVQIAPVVPMQQSVPMAPGMAMPPVLPMAQPVVPVPGGMPLVSTVSPAVVAPKLTSPPTAKPNILPPPPTPPQSNPPSRHMSISEKPPSIDSPQVEWAISVQTKLKYTQVFNSADRTRSGFLTGVQARGILVHSNLPHAILAQIWTLADMDCDGRLSCEEFILAMYLCDKAMNGEKIPTTLPPELIPPGFRKTSSRQGSIAGSRHGSISTSRNASISSQGAMDGDPAAGLPQSSFEDKRKENFDKGQAELDRRRKLLMDQQRKEQEERERKERDEIEKREKARIEAERKQQEELERQLQQQREIEIEKEEQRKRALEAKEAARKELEKQRQQEWEQARIAEMNSQKQREQEKVLKLKAQNQTLNVELSTLNEKIKDLSQKICDTRAGVTNVKSVIDGMRTTRDTSMSEMAQLKARIKEQNAKLLQLTQEKAKWEAKTKSGQFADGANQEQMNAAFASKQLIIKQLQDKNENIRREIESKQEDNNSNDEQMAEIKAELTDLIEKCEELYTKYDTQRTQVLELKYNKKNENLTATSAWETSATTASSWGGATTAEVANDINIVDTSGPAPEGFVKYRAVYEFSGRNADEITFNPGDIIFVPLEQNAEPGWLAGEINGHTGWFPETYVEKIEENYPTETEVSTLQDTYNDNNQQYDDYTIPVAETDETMNGDGEYYIAAYPYESNEVGDLAFVAGEMVFVTKKEGDWWTGTIGERIGMFPSNYVQKVDAQTSESTQVTKEEVVPADSYVDDQKEYNVNGNAQPYETTQDIIQDDSELKNLQLQKQQQQQQQQQNETSIPLSTKVTTTTTIDDSRTQEELDTEVSQINTQSKSIEHSESFSRPMSRTSSMTPGMRGKRSEIAQVIAPYEATSKEQLSLTRGQLIMIRKKTDSGWWEGELQAKGRRRQIGWFPATYVKVLQGGRNSGRNTPVSASRVEMGETILDKVIALYPYKAQNDDELSFEKDDIISVLGRDEPDWWRGELNGLTGVFPSNYVGPFVTSGKMKDK